MRYVERYEGREVKVCKVVRYVAVHVSSVIITLAGSMDPVGMGVSKIASKGGCGGDRGMLAGRAGTGGNSSEFLGEDFKEDRLAVIGGEVETLSSTGTGGGARVGREGVDEREGVTCSTSSFTSGSDSCSSSSSKSGIGGNGGDLGCS